jgi:DNA polymerase III delta prime subunit
MTFYTRHEPKSFNDLVFHDPKVAQTIHEYATGLRPKHLLLYGPPGSGKSKAAEIIVNACLGNSGLCADDAKFDLPTLEQYGFAIVATCCSRQMLNGASRCYAIIDEVDHLKSATLLSMRSFFDTAKYVTFVCTTNNLHRLDSPLQNRFEKLHLDLPSANDWIPRAMHIMQAEGHPVSEKQLQMLLNAEAYSARDLMSQLENAILMQTNKAPATAQSSNVVPIATPLPPAQPAQSSNVVSAAIALAITPSTP